MKTQVLALAVGGTAIAHKVPHGGALYEGAEHKFHAELKLDAKSKEVTVFILDGKAKKLVPIKAKPPLLPGFTSASRARIRRPARRSRWPRRD